MARRRRYRGTPVPPLHLVLIYSCSGLSVLAGLAYFFAPPGKAETFAGILLVLTGFLTGKMSNSFGKPMIPPAVDTDGDGDIDEEDMARAIPARGAGERA